MADSARGVPLDDEVLRRDPKHQLARRGLLRFDPLGLAVVEVLANRGGEFPAQLRDGLTQQPSVTAALPSITITSPSATGCSP